MPSEMTDGHLSITSEGETSDRRERSSQGATGGRSETETRILALFVSGLEIEVGVDTDVMASGLLDSMAFVQLLLELEEEFEITVSLGSVDLEDFQSVRSIARLVDATRGPVRPG